MEKILLISPFPKNNNLYPHLAEFIDCFSEYFEIEYFYIKERGYWIDELVTKIVKNPFQISNIKSVYSQFKDYLRLIKRRNINYKFAIAVDNYPYIIGNFALKCKIILWNHDFVSYDQAKWRSRIHQYIANKTRKYLNQQKVLIIQDPKRYEIFLKSINLQNPDLSVYYLPISLLPLKKKIIHDNNLPTIMQIGGISEIRSGSDKLIDYYQNHDNEFELYLHGIYFSTEIIKMLNEVDKIPIISYFSLSYKQIFRIVEKCDIGFIYYVSKDQNFYNISYASGQLAEFLRGGKPIISFDNSSLGKHIEDLKIGKCIKDINELSYAIRDIMNNYVEYSNNCKQIFEKHYNLKTNIEKLINDLIQ